MKSTLKFTSNAKNGKSDESCIYLPKREYTHWLICQYISLDLFSPSELAVEEEGYESGCGEDRFYSAISVTDHDAVSLGCADALIANLTASDWEHFHFLAKVCTDSLVVLSARIKI